MPVINLIPTAPTWITTSFREVLLASAASSVLRIPQGTLPTVSITTADATGRAVEYTTSPDTMLIDDTAVWRTWPLGVVTSASTDMDDTLVGPVTAVRLSNAVGKDGAVTWEVVV